MKAFYNFLMICRCWNSAPCLLKTVLPFTIILCRLLKVTCSPNSSLSLSVPAVPQCCPSWAPKFLEWLACAPFIFTSFRLLLFILDVCVLERVAVGRTPFRIPEVFLPSMSFVFRVGKSLTFRKFKLSTACSQITKLRRFSPAAQPYSFNATYTLTWWLLDLFLGPIKRGAVVCLLQYSIDMI